MNCLILGNWPDKKVNTVSTLCTGHRCYKSMNSSNKTERNHESVIIPFITVRILQHDFKCFFCLYFRNVLTKDVATNQSSSGRKALGTPNGEVSIAFGCFWGVPTIHCRISRCSSASNFQGFELNWQLISFPKLNQFSMLYWMLL